MERRTDLAQEAHELWREQAGAAAALPGVRAQDGESHGFPRTVVTIEGKAGADALGRPPGRYVTIELTGLLRREQDAFRRAVEAVGEEIAALVPPEGEVLVVGLGSRTVTPDLVGPMAADHLLVTRHLRSALPEQFGALRSVAAAVPGVLAATGVESAEAAAALTRRLRPACVVAVDALASRSVERLCRTVQLSDTGIAPGSGVGNHRRALTRESLGVPVIAVGVPTVVDAATLALDLLERAGCPAPDRDALGGLGAELFVTPREVDARVADLARVIGYGVSLGLNPGLTVDELTMLLE